jgi:hypothetical protein
MTLARLERLTKGLDEQRATLVVELCRTAMDAAIAALYPESSELSSLDANGRASAAAEGGRLEAQVSGSVPCQ